MVVFDDVLIAQTEKAVETTIRNSVVTKRALITAHKNAVARHQTRFCQARKPKIAVKSVVCYRRIGGDELQMRAVVVFKSAVGYEDALRGGPLNFYAILSRIINSAICNRCIFSVVGKNAELSGLGQF